MREDSPSKASNGKLLANIKQKITRNTDLSEFMLSAVEFIHLRKVMGSIFVRSIIVILSEKKTRTWERLNILK